MNHLTILVITISLVVLTFSKHPAYCQNNAEVFILQEDRSAILVDGKSEDWTDDPLLCGLHSPWTDHGKDKTILYAAVDNRYFYFCFIVEDKTPTINEFQNEMSIDLSDRVELFFSNSEELDNYYCLEIDRKGNIMDYQASSPRKFNFDWKAKKLKIRSENNLNSYIVEGKLKRSALKSMEIRDEFYLGIFRADYYGGDQSDAYWLTAKIPNSENPDFHIPSAFTKTRIVRK